MTQEQFQELKSEILRRAHEAYACKEEYGRAYKAETLQELLSVVKDNFDWAYDNGVIDIALIEKYKQDFADNQIYANQDVTGGYLLCDSATVEACGSATVVAFDSAYIKAYGSVSVKACGSASVGASDSATVRAWGSASVVACDSASVVASDLATVKVCDSATVVAWGSTSVKACGSATVRACGSVSVEAYGSVSVEAWGSAYVNTYRIIECKLFDNAIWRIRSTNEIRYASENLKFTKL